MVDGCHHLQTTTTAAADFFSLDGGGADIDKRLLAVVVVVVHNCKQRSCTRSTCVAMCENEKRREEKSWDRKKLPFRSP